ncbi:MAG: ribonuclease P protein component [Bacteroidota bacterium]
MRKGQRISGIKRIEHLFGHGKSFISYPLRVVYVIRSSRDDYPIAVMVSVPKKKLKSAVARNRMKRLVREAFRQNSHLLDIDAFPHEQSLDIAFVYLKDELCDYATIQKAVLKALSEIARQMKGNKKC